MQKNALELLGSFVIVAVISIVLVYFRSEGMTTAEILAKRGLGTIKRENIIFFGLVMPATVCLISYFVYRRWYVGQPIHFLFLAIGMGIVLSIMAAIFYRKAFYELALLHVIHIFFFGWLLPLYIK
jgi:hypothetical protein